VFYHLAHENPEVLQVSAANTTANSLALISAQNRSNPTVFRASIGFSSL
jgi:hypothetical protein